jgi:hypothetical protein
VKASKDNMIHINAEWALKGNDLCVALLKKRINKHGQAVWDEKGYFNNFTQALHRLIDMDVQPLNNIKYICERIDELKQSITDALKK